MSMRKQLASIPVRLSVLLVTALSLSPPASAALGSPRIEAPPITAKTTTKDSEPSSPLHVSQPVLDQHNDIVNTTTTTTSTNEHEQEHEHEHTTNDELLEWVLSLEGGYWNTEKQRMGYDKNGLFGVFATQVIQDNEILAQIPWTAVLKPPSNNETRTRKPSRFDNCDTVQLLKDEFAKGNASYYHHYTKALQETAQVHRSLLPAYWSEAGQALLQRVVSDTLPPRDLFLRDFEFKNNCQSIHQDATVLVLTHGEDFGMVPLTDRYNSRGGDYTGAYFSIDGGRSQFVPGKDDDGMKPTPNDDNQIALEIRAWRTVQPGEQIFTDYHDYGQIGTPELLRDYGFVELYPQKYIFHEQGIAFDIDLVFMNEEDEEEGDYRGPFLQVTWLHQVRKMSYFHPFDHNPHLENRKRMSMIIQFLQGEHERLQQHVCPFLNTTETTTDQQQPTPQEVETAIRFCHATMVAMEAALHDLGIPVRQRSNLRRLGILGSIGRDGRNDEDCPDGSCSDEL